MLPQQGWTATDKTPDGLSDMRAARAEAGPDAPDDPVRSDTDVSSMVAGPDVIRSTRASAELNRPEQGGLLAAGQSVVLSLSPQTKDATGAVATCDSNLQGVQVGSPAALQAELDKVAAPDPTTPAPSV